MISSVRLRRIIVSAVLLAATGLRLPAGQTPPAASAVDPRPRSPYFSGFVTELKPDSIVVSRKSSNSKTAIQKVFSIDPHTKVEGKLKENSRVTVRYETLGNIQRAIRIIVR